MAPPLSLISRLKKTNSNLYDFLSQLVSTVNIQDTQIAEDAPIISNPPNIVTGASVSSQPYTTKNNNLALLTSFSFVPPIDINWETCQIYISNYLGNNNYVYLTEGSISPLSLLLEMTGEIVTFQFVSQNNNGETNIGSGPTVTHVLNSVSTNPPAPSVNTQQTANATGFQFSFNVESGLLDDVIQAYKIYRNTTNTFSGAQIIKIIPSTNTTGIIYNFQDILSSISNYYYWVSAVNTSGLESSPTPAFNITIPFDNSLGTQPLSQSQVIGVSGNQTTTPSYTPSSITDNATVTCITQTPLTYNSFVPCINFDVSLVPDNGSVLIFIDGECYNTSANNVPVSVVLYKNGVQLGRIIQIQVPFLTAGGYSSFSFVRIDTSPGTSSNTYQLYAELLQNVSNTVYVNDGTITALNVKA